jgi:metal-responsive CopG/Arc/MetJ family transcriptional regulator
MVSMPEELLKRIDEEAERTGRTRSGLLQYVARLYLTEKATRMPPGERPEVRAAMARAREVLKRNPPRGGAPDSTEIVREARDARYGSGERHTGKRRKPSP